MRPSLALTTTALRSEDLSGVGQGPVQTAAGMAPVPVMLDEVGGPVTAPGVDGLRRVAEIHRLISDLKDEHIEALTDRTRNLMARFLAASVARFEVPKQEASHE